MDENGKTYRIVALEWLEGVDTCYWRWIADPLQCLPIGNNPHIIHCIDCVQELDESFFVMRLGEPGCVVEQAEGCSAKNIILK